MKKLVAISLIIFLFVVGYVLIDGYLSGKMGEKIDNFGKKQLSFTPQEIEKHNVHTDCWMIIYGKVYDITGFLGKHSGGVDSMLPHCGKNGTSAFETKDRVPPKDHKEGDIDILQAYYIGDLK